MARKQDIRPERADVFDFDSTELKAEIDAKASLNKPTYTRPIYTSADKLAMIHGDTYETNTGQTVSAYSYPISLC